MKLNRSYVVTAIETQGRFAMGSGHEFMPNYQIEYSRNAGLSWHKWKDFKGSYVSVLPIVSFEKIYDLVSFFSELACASPALFGSSSNIYLSIYLNSTAQRERQRQRQR